MLLPRHVPSLVIGRARPSLRELAIPSHGHWPGTEPRARRSENLADDACHPRARATECRQLGRVCSSPPRRPRRSECADLHRYEWWVPVMFSLLTFEPTDKYSQIYRILLPICNTLSKIKTLTSPALTQYIQSEFGSTDELYRTILTDFFRHGFDGSGADNFYDAVRGKRSPLSRGHLVNRDTYNRDHA